MHVINLKVNNDGTLDTKTILPLHLGTQGDKACVKLKLEIGDTVEGYYQYIKFYNPQRTVIQRVERKERVLVTTLTKKMAEDLTEEEQKELDQRPLETKHENRVQTADVNAEDLQLHYQYQTEQEKEIALPKSFSYLKTAVLFLLMIALLVVPFLPFILFNSSLYWDISKQIFLIIFLCSLFFLFLMSASIMISSFDNNNNYDSNENKNIC